MATSKSDNQILQDFIGTLLKDPGVEFDAPDVEHSVVNLELIQPSYVVAETDFELPKETAELSAADLKLLSNIEVATSPQPLLSERLQRAKSLLQTMPVVEEFEKPSETVEKLPTVLAGENFLSAMEKIADDEIIQDEDLSETSADEFVSEIKAIPEHQFDAENSSEVANVLLESPLENGIPEWGQGSFQTLIFNIGELKLAVPLVKLGGIHPIHSKPTPMPEKPDWYMGLLAHDQGNISVIDTALWIMPEKYQIAKAKGLDYELLILLDDSRWGLACSRVDNTITLTEQDIRWNSKNSKRPWLAGMVIGEMCALIDVQTLIKILDGDDPQHQIMAS